MKVNEFIEKLKEVEKKPTLYGWGTFMNKYKGKYLLCDCSGLIKGVLWGYPDKGKYASNGVPDINANTMIGAYCYSVSTNFYHLTVGALVHMEGHIGVHIGNGVCIESSPKWEDGIQKTFIKGSGYANDQNLNERNWTSWGLFKFIDYENNSVSSNRPDKPLGNYVTNVDTVKLLGTYVVNVETSLVVRTGPGTNYARKSKSELTSDGQKHSNSRGGLLPGTRVTVKEWIGNWARIPSGWVCGDYLKYVGG